MRGKAAGSSGDYSTAGDHPRVCGEKIWLSSVCVHASGSPPRMRGKVPGLLLQHLTHGITPAYAGKSGWFQRRLQHGGGSPPRMRGKDLVKFCLCPRFGITPAYAGKSPRTPLAASHARDHPRVCGEKYTCAAVRAGSLGSPPRMRGKDGGQDAVRVNFGITPAYAGKSSASSCLYRPP